MPSLADQAVRTQRLGGPLRFERTRRCVQSFPSYIAGLLSCTWAYSCGRIWHRPESRPLSLPNCSKDPIKRRRSSSQGVPFCRASWSSWDVYESHYTVESPQKITIETEPVTLSLSLTANSLETSDDTINHSWSLDTAVDAQSHTRAVPVRVQVYRLQLYTVVSTGLPTSAPVGVQGSDS